MGSGRRVLDIYLPGHYIGKSVLLTCCMPMLAVEETSNAMALDGIMFEGVSVRVRRPNDYNPAAAAALGPAVPNPALNLSAIGLHPGGMNAVWRRSCLAQHLSVSLVISAVMVLPLRQI